MNSETIALIDKLATKLGTTAEALWGVLIVQAKVEAIGMAVQSVILIFITVAFCFLVRRFIKIENEYGSDNAGTFVACLLLGLITVVCWVAAIASVDEFLTAIMNPDGYALKYILRVMK